MAYPVILGSDFRQLSPSLSPQAPYGIDPGSSIPSNATHGPPGIYRVDAFGRPLVRNNSMSSSAGGQYTCDPRGQMYPVTYGPSKQYRQPYGTTSGDSPYVPRAMPQGYLSQFAAGNSKDPRPGFSSEPTEYVF
jgi:hypothetical protein